MKLCTTAAGNTLLSADEARVKLDNVAKQLLADRQFLARIMKSYVREYKDIPLHDIETKYIDPQGIYISKIGVAKNVTNTDLIVGDNTESKSVNEGNVTYDLAFSAIYPGKEGLYIQMYMNVEIQNNYYPGYPIETRGAYYAARRLTAQLPTINQDTDYGKLKKSYSIWLCIGNVPKKHAGTVSSYKLTKKDLVGNVYINPDVYDLLEVIVIRFNDDAICKDRTLKILQTLFTHKISNVEKINKLNEYGVAMTEEIKGGIGSMCTYGEYIAETSRREGKIEGKAEERAESIVTYIDNVIVNLNVPVERACEILNVSLKDYNDSKKILGR